MSETMHKRIAPLLIALALAAGCAPEEPGVGDEPSAGVQTEPGVEPAPLPAPPEADTVRLPNAPSDD